MKILKINHLVNIVLVAFFVFGIPAFTSAQKDDGLIERLENRLFPLGKNTIKIREVESCEEQLKHEERQIREVQPDLLQVVEVLKEVVCSKNTSLLNPLINLYERHIEFYKEEWEPVHRENFYACEAANEAYQILEAFEEAIHSLKFGKMDLRPEEMYHYHSRYLHSQYRYYYKGGEWFEALKDWKIHSSYFRMLREKKWCGPPGNYFCYIEPYLPEVQDFFVEDIINYVNSDDAKEMSMLYEDFIFKHLCRLAGKIDDCQLSRQLLGQSIFYSKADYRFAYKNLFFLFKGPINRIEGKEILKDAVLKGNVENRWFPLWGLSFFVEIEVLDFYSTFLKNENASQKEKGIIDKNISYFINAKNVPDKIKKRARRVLKATR